MSSHSVTEKLPQGDRPVSHKATAISSIGSWGIASGRGQKSNSEFNTEVDVVDVSDSQLRKEWQGLDGREWVGREFLREEAR